jgi:hypothetical protein
VKLLEVPVETVEQAVSQMLTNGSLQLEEIDGEPLVFLPHLRKAEDGIATKVKRLAAAGVRIRGGRGIRRRIAWRTGAFDNDEGGPLFWRTPARTAEGGWR